MFSTCLKSFLPFSSNVKCRLQPVWVQKSLKFVVWERVKFDENDRKFSKRVENIFPQSFRKTCSADMWKQGLVCKRVNPFPNDKILDWSILKEFANFMKMAECFPNGQNTLWEKEKLLVTSNFSFSHSVFKRHVLQTCENKGLFAKGLRNPGKNQWKAFTSFPSLVEKYFICFHQILLTWARLKYYLIAWYNYEQ